MSLRISAMDDVYPSGASIIKGKSHSQQYIPLKAHILVRLLGEPGHYCRQHEINTR